MHFFNVAGIISGIMSSLVLSPSASNATEMNISEEQLAFCGANDCPLYRNDSQNANFEEVSQVMVSHFIQ